MGHKRNCYFGLAFSFMLVISALLLTGRAAAQNTVKKDPAAPIQQDTGGYWVLDNMNIVKDLPPDKTEGEGLLQMNFQADIASGSATLSDDWDGNGSGDYYYNCKEGHHESIHTWTPPPSQLTPGESITITLSVTVNNTANLPNCDWAYGAGNGVDLAIGGNLAEDIAGVYAQGLNQIVSDNAEVEWTVPGKSAEPLELIFTISGGLIGPQYVRYAYKWQPGPAAQPTSTPEPTQAEPTPVAPVTLEGVVTIEGTNLPLGDVSIVLLQKNQPVVRGITTGDGVYQFPLELERPVKDLTLGVILEEAVTKPAAFKVIYEPDPDPVYTQSKVFEIPAGEEPTFRHDIAFGGTDMLAGQTIPSGRLQDMGMVYYYTRQAYQEAVTFRQQTLDFAPALTVRANNPKFEDLGAYWSGPNSLGGRAGMAPYIGLSERMSSPNRFMRAGGVIWHEFGHDVMADAYGNMMPRDPTGTAHLGFFNPSTTDSWIEGFATFYALLVNRDSNLAAGASVWYGGNYSVNMEVNYRSTSSYGNFGGVPPTSREEFAVASLLWDLVDPEDPQDCSPLMYNAKVGELFKITPAAPIADASLTLYCDYMELATQDLWTILTADASQIDPSPAAGNFPYIFDVKQLYEVLVRNRVGEDLTYNGITALDELFVAHGFFADTKPQNFTYDIGESLGLTSNLAFKCGNANFPARDIRRSPPPLVNSYLGVSVQDAQTGQAVEANDYEVTVRFDPPYELYNYSYIAPLSAPGQLYIEPPDSQYDATISVLPVGDGAPPSTQPVEFTTAQYWEWMGQDPSGSFLEHTFQVSPQGSTEVPSNEPATSETKNNGPIVIAVLACCCLLILVIATAGGVLFFIRRSRSKSGRVSHRSG